MIGAVFGPIMFFVLCFDLSCFVIGCLQWANPSLWWGVLAQRSGFFGNPEIGDLRAPNCAPKPGATSYPSVSINPQLYGDNCSSSPAGGGNSRRRRSSSSPANAPTGHLPSTRRRKRALPEPGASLFPLRSFLFFKRNNNTRPPARSRWIRRPCTSVTSRTLPRGGTLATAAPWHAPAVRAGINGARASGAPAGPPPSAAPHAQRRRHVGQAGRAAPAPPPLNAGQAGGARGSQLALLGPPLAPRTHRVFVRCLPLPLTTPIRPDIRGFWASVQSGGHPLPQSLPRTTPFRPLCRGIWASVCEGDSRGRCPGSRSP